MVCSEIRELFSEYLDDALSGESKTLVEEHLSSCEACRQELASLGSVLREVRSLGPVEPPQDFLEQLHKRMEERSWFVRGLRKLFVPMRIKIPLQVAGTVVAAFLVVSILSVRQPAYRSSMAPVGSGPEVLKEQPMKAAPKNEAEYRPSRMRSRQAPPVTAGRIPADERVKGAELQTHPDEGVSPRAQSTFTRKPAVEKALVNLVIRMRKDAAGGAAALAPEATALKAPQKKAVDPSLQQVRSLIEDARGKVLSVEYDKKTGELESVHAEIPAAQYSHVYHGLSTLGDVQAPAEAPPPEDRGPVELRIRVAE
jgi:hypothetical protein